MRILIYNIVFLLFLVACKGSKETAQISQTMDKDETKNTTEKIVNMSTFTRKFIEKLNKEMKDEIENFQPSNNLINEFDLNLINDKYYVDAFVEFDSTLQISNLKKMGIIFSSKYGKMYIVSIPIKMINKLTKTEYVNYLQIAEKIQKENK